MINISPLAPYHSVIAVRVKECLPQALTLESLRVAFAILKASRRKDMRIVFNSMGAWASQNHLHLHIVYLHKLGFTNDTLPLEAAKSEKFLESKSEKQGRNMSAGIELVSGYPIHSFRFHMDRNTDEKKNSNSSVVIPQVWRLVEILQKRGIAHNVVFSHGTTSKEVKI